MDFSTLPPELVGQMPLVALLLWIGIQSRKELLAAMASLTERVDQVRLEVRALRVDLGRDVLDDDLPPAAPAPPPPTPAAARTGELHR